jgi:hypothetical protein
MNNESENNSSSNNNNNNNSNNNNNNNNNNQQHQHQHQQQHNSNNNNNYYNRGQYQENIAINNGNNYNKIRSKQQHNPYKIIITQEDTQICRDHAQDMHRLYSEINFDHNLQVHLDAASKAAEQNLYRNSKMS